MLFTNGIEENLKNVLLLSRPFMGENVSRTRAYADYLNRIQPEIYRSDLSEPEFITSGAHVSRYIELFNVDSALNDIHNEVVEAGVCQEQIDLVRKHHRSFCEEQPAIAGLFNLVIRSIFCARSERAGGGTTSVAIGVLWCDPRPSWTKQDFFEFFIHEMTHTLMFLDERVHQHYRSLPEILSKDNYFLSAILNVPRPLDKVIHSLIVAIEILMYREKLAGHGTVTRCHPPSWLLIDQVRSCIQGLKESPRFHELSAMHGVRLVEKSEEMLSELSAARPSGKGVLSCK